MATTVEAGFVEFHGRLTPSHTESEAAKSHRKSIKSCLEDSFGMTNFFQSGSFGNGTSVRYYSDVDYFAVIPTGNLKLDSAATLRQVRDALDKRFPNTGVCVRTPAVLVPFGKDAWESTEVVPADLVDSSGTYNVYDIANGAGGWRKSSPSTHKAYVGGQDSRLGNKVKPLIRFVKAWKYFKSVPISSFYLELRVAEYSATQTCIQYSYDVRAILKKLAECGLAAIQDPKGVSGYITACGSEASKQDALSKLDTALTRANNALRSEIDGKIREAFGWWDLVFNQCFCSYG